MESSSTPEDIGGMLVGESRSSGAVGFLKIFLWVAVVATAAAKAEGTATKQLAAAAAKHYVVKVSNYTSNVFAPDISGGHGTGFVIEITDDKVVVLTNRHVVERDDALEAQVVLVEFPSDKGLPEKVVASVPYVSPLYDFAVVEIPKSELKRSLGFLRTAPIADDAEFENLTQQGTSVMAYGHPLDSNNVSTYGEISAVHPTHDGVYIQTTAPINPGNSGGPLIELETGKVVGINTAKITGADNTGYVLPIPTVRNAYKKWRADRTLRHPRAILARFDGWSTQEVALDGLAPALKRAVPDFFEHHRGLLAVTDAAPSTGLLPGDLVVRVDGTVIGVDKYVLDELVLHAGETIPFEVLRGKKLETVNVPVKRLGMALLRQEVDFVMISGLVFQEFAADRAWAIGQNRSKVFVSAVVPFSSAANDGLFIRGAVLEEVQFDGKRFPIGSLKDLRQAMAKHSGKGSVRIVYHAPIRFRTEHGMMRYGDDDFGGAQVHAKRDVAQLSLEHYVTPRDLRLRLMKAAFDFSNSNPESRDWRYWLGKTDAEDCAHELLVNAAGD